MAAVGFAVFFLLRQKRRQREGRLTHEVPHEKPGMSSQVIKPQEGESQCTDRVLSSNSVLTHELDSTKPLSELPLNNNGFETGGRGDGFSRRGSPYPTYEMDGHVYTFQP